MITMSKLEYNNRDSSSITALEGTLEVTPASATSLSPELEEIFSTLVKSVNSHTRRAYTTDARYFLAWLRAEGRTVETANFATMMSYHAHLADTCKPGLAARRFTVARRLGIVMLMRQVALEYARDGIRANTICPGAIHTGMNARRMNDPKFKEATGKSIPLGYVADPIEVANTALFIAIDESRYITGNLS